jgi:hypothetical protein
MKLLMDVSFQLSIRDEDWMLGTDTYTAYFRPAVVFAPSMILALMAEQPTSDESRSKR